MSIYKLSSFVLCVASLPGTSTCTFLLFFKIFIKWLKSTTGIQMPVCVGPEVPIGQRLARSLAKVKEVTWDKVNLQLFGKCPQPSEQREGVFILTTAGQEAVIALGKLARNLTRTRTGTAFALIITKIPLLEKQQWHWEISESPDFEN